MISAELNITRKRLSFHCVDCRICFFSKLTTVVVSGSFTSVLMLASPSASVANLHQVKYFLTAKNIASNLNENYRENQ